MFENRIPFYNFLSNYRKSGYNVIQFQQAIKADAFKSISFNSGNKLLEIAPKAALIIINDFIANNKKQIESNTQLQLFPLV